MEEGGSKRKRGPNLTTNDRDLIMDLVVKYQSIIENKKTDAINSRQKEEAWKKVEEEFNAISFVKREWPHLRQAYENLKKKAKKDAASDKIERYKTGGGTFVKQCDAASEKLLAVLGNRAHPLPNSFDSDAAYNCDLNTSGSEAQEPVLPTKELYIEIVGELPLAKSLSTGQPNMPFVKKEKLTPQIMMPMTSSRPPSSCNVFRDVQTLSSCSAPLVVQPLSSCSVPRVVQPPSSCMLGRVRTPSPNDARPPPACSAPPSRAPSPMVDQPPSSSSAPQSRTSSPNDLQPGPSSTSSWSQRRRPSLPKQRKTILSTRTEATAKISESADAKASYYKEKLAMEKKEHEMRIKEHEMNMKILAAKEEFYKKRSELLK